METKITLVLLISCLLSYATCANPTISINTLKKTFDSVKPYSDLSNAFYSAKGLQLLGETLPTQAHGELCNFIKSKVDKSNLESIYYATSLAASLQNCALTVADFQAALTAGSTSQVVSDLYYYSLISQNLKQPIDSKKLSKSILDGLKADSSILNQAYSLHIASLFTADDDAKKFYGSIDDILDQADEVDKKYLQYEGGVGTTSLVLEGIFTLSERVKQFSAKFDQARLSKFVNYLTSKRFPTNIKSAFFLLRASQKLSDNKFKVPVILNRLSQVGLTSAQPNLVVGITNILGQAIKQVKFNLEAESAKSQRQNGPVLLASKKSFASKSSDGSTFEVKLLDNQKVDADFYLVRVNAVPATPDARFFLVDQTVEVKVSTTANLADIQVGVADRDQTAPKLQSVQEPNQLKLEADQQSKLFVKFTVKDKSKNVARAAHQTFVRLTQAKTGKEIVFLAQSQSSSLQYSAEIDLFSNAKNFRHSSGVYTVELIVSDALIENSLQVKLAEIKIQFVEDSSANLASDKAKLYEPLPEIKHTFRLPEQTPPAIVSTVFSALCLAPLLLLFILWIKIGFNFSKFTFSLSGIIFHLSLVAIFGLFFCYWIKLNMFQTLRYLLAIGLVALFSGSSLLKHLASQTATKEKKNN